MASTTSIGRLVAVGLGGAVGSSARHGAVSLGGNPSFTIVVVNVIGSAMLGALIANRSTSGAGGLGDTWTAFVGIGFCGGLTTFSTHAVDVAQRVADGRWIEAGLSLAATSVLCVAAAVVGHRLLRGLDHTAAS